MGGCTGARWPSAISAFCGGGGGRSDLEAALPRIGCAFYSACSSVCFLLLILWLQWWGGLLFSGRPPSRWSCSRFQIPPPGTGGSCGVRSPVWRLLRRAWQQLLGCCFPSAAASEVMDGRCAAVTTARWKTVACVVFPVIFLFRRGLFVICGAAALACCFVILFLIQI